MRRILWSLTIASFGLAGYGSAIAAEYSYSSVVTLCTGTCDSFASLALGSTITGTIEIDTTPGGTFGDADIGNFTFSVFNPALPVSGPVGDPVNDNPLVLDSALGIAASNGTAGTTDGINEINGGQMLIEFLEPPFSSNGAFVVIDLSTGNGQICLFFATAGCIPGATEAVKFEGSFSLVGDSDGDGVLNNADNCTNVANANQVDTNGDGHGNRCDADLNQDCIVNAIDLGLFRLRFFTPDPDADLDGSGSVNAIDLGILKQLFFDVPGPSAGGACTPQN